MASGNESNAPHHHRNNLEHEKFNPKCHKNLLINLCHLPPTTNVMSYQREGLGQVPIPSFLYYPMVALYRRGSSIFASDVFDLDAIGTEYIALPTPYNPKCAVCEAVKFFLDPQINDIDRKVKACELPSQILFEVCRELWVRLNPKPLRLNKEQLDWAVDFNIVQLLESTEFYFPERKEPLNLLAAHDRMIESAHWTNAITYQTSVDLRTHQTFFLRGLAEFLFHEFLVLIRNYTTRKLKDANIAEVDPHFIMIAAMKLGDEYLRPILKLIRAISASLTSVYEVTPKGIIEYFPDRDDKEHHLLKEFAVMNIFLTNRPEAFSPLAFPTGGIIHKVDCPENPKGCYCRFTRARYTSVFFDLQ